MWSCVSVAEGANEASGFTRSALRVRRKEDWYRRQEVQIHSVEGRREGRIEPLREESAIVLTAELGCCCLFNFLGPLDVARCSGSGALRCERRASPFAADFASQYACLRHEILHIRLSGEHFISVQMMTWKILGNTPFHNALETKGACWWFKSKNLISRSFCCNQSKTSEPFLTRSPMESFDLTMPQYGCLATF